MNSEIQKTLFIDQLQAGQQVRDIFLLSKKTLYETKAGKPYLALGLMDRTGEIEARLWDNALHFDGAAATGDFVFVTGVAKPYREQLQLTVAGLEAVGEHEVALEQFLPASKRPLEEMRHELKEVLDGVADPAIRALLEEIFQGKNLEDFIHAPAAKKMHHAYIGGLVEHTLSIIGMAHKTADHYPMLDRDLLVAGALLHDIAKIREFDFARPPFEYTDQGRLVGHLVLGAEMVRQAAGKVKGLTTEKVDQVVHLILSHHGQLEFGSPVLPMTPEAMLLHHLDDMDAKMNYMEQLSRKMEEPGYQWTEYQRPLERFLYLRGQGQEGKETLTENQGYDHRTSRKERPKPLSSGQAKQKQQSLF